jgi:hypothetical protein
MPTKIHPAASRLHDDGLPLLYYDNDNDNDRLPLNIAAPIVVALSLSLWVGIGFVIRCVALHSW